MSDKKKPNKVKDIRRLSRETKIAGRGGAHKNKRDKRVRKKSTEEYLSEYEEEVEEVEEDI